MVSRTATMRYRRYNTYVPACAFAHDVIEQGAGGYQIDFKTPAAAVAAGVLSAQSIATAGSLTTGSTGFLSDTSDAPFGRNVTVVASGASTSTITVRGKDYLGQPMTEVLTANGTTPVVGVKAFYWLDSITWTATAAVTINVGFGSRLGLPYRMSQVMTESVNGVGGTLGTLVAGSLTDPQTATTGDPRGTYAPSGSLNGTNRILASMVPHNLVNTNGNGGLYGIPHFSS